MTRKIDVINWAKSLADRGIGWDADGVYGTQCVDLTNGIATKFFNKPLWGNAIDLLDSAKAQGFEVIYDEVGIAPLAGDCFVMKTWAHPYGHTGLVIEDSDGYTVKTIEQNIDGNYDALIHGAPARYNERAFSDGDGQIIGWIRFPYNEKMSQLDGNVQPFNNAGLYYCAHVQDIGWREWIHDGMIAGSTGAGKRLEALKIDCSKVKGLHIDVKAHIQDEGWKLYKDVKPDDVIGTTGKKRRIEALEIQFADNNEYKGDLRYQVHLSKYGWTGTVKEGFTAGTVGIKTAIEAIKIWAV
jgi:hypothetical protein